LWDQVRLGKRCFLFIKPINAWERGLHEIFFKILLLKINFFYILDRFDTLILKIKNIILMYFRMKNTLKNNRSYTLKEDI